MSNAEETFALVFNEPFQIKDGDGQISMKTCGTIGVLLKVNSEGSSQLKIMPTKVLEKAKLKSIVLMPNFCEIES